MNSFEMIANLIHKKPVHSSDLAYILNMDEEEIIQNLIGVKGGFIFRAYLVERLLELLHGPKGVAVPEEIYRQAILQAKEQASGMTE